MLTETLAISTLSPSKSNSSSTSRDVGVHLHTYQPLASPQHSFKKSSTAPNCLAVSSSHIFAAQADKAVVHVYSREYGNQEVVVPFPERTRSIALAGEYEEGTGCLVMGTEGGRLMVWELPTGRLVTTPTSHLEPVTSLAISPDHSHILSGAADAQIHVWSLPSLLSFAASTNAATYTPQRTLSSHRGQISSLTMGHSRTKTNIAISASKDNTIIVWDYISGESLRVFLLSEPAVCLTLDPADRAFYAGYADGSVHMINLFSTSDLMQQVRNPVPQATPTQPSEQDRWKLPDDADGQGMLCIDTSYDGTTLISGHENGKMCTWDIAKGQWTSTVHDYALPITNLMMLPPIGWPKSKTPQLRLRQVVKPRYESTFSADSGGGGTRGVPLYYAFTSFFPSSLSLSSSSATSESLFQEALVHPCFPTSLLEEGLTAFNPSSSAIVPPSSLPSSPPFDVPKGTKDVSEVENLRQQNAFLTEQLGQALARSKEAIKENLRHDRERWKQQDEARMKAETKKRRRLRRLQIQEFARKRAMGEPVDEDEEMGEGVTEAKDEDQDLSSSTDEITDSD